MDTDAAAGSGELLDIVTYRGAEKGLVAAAVLCLLVGYTGLGMRIILRRKETGRFTVDSWMASAGLVLMTGFAAASIVSVTEGISLARFLQAQLASEVLYALSLLPLKLSFLTLYRPFLSSTLERTVTVFIGALIIIYSFTDFVTLLTQCSPHRAWLAGQPVRCIDIHGLLLTIGIFDILTNLSILALPLPFLYQSRNSTDKKIRITTFLALFLGALAVLFSIIRTPFLVSHTHSLALSALSLVLLTALHLAHLLTTLPSLPTLLMPTPNTIIQRHWHPTPKRPDYERKGSSPSSIFSTWSILKVFTSERRASSSDSIISSRSDARLFGGWRTPEPPSLFSSPLRINVKTVMEQSVEEIGVQAWVGDRADGN